MTDIGHLIQLAVAPVFLLTGIAAFLGVLSNRLGRITDRARILERRLASSNEEAKLIIEKELANLWRRINIINRAILLCTISALLICLVVVALFVSSFVPYSLSEFISILFIATMICLTCGLIYFLREVNRATRTMQIGLEAAITDIEQD